jgi:hypothetical protein
VQNAVSAKDIGVATSSATFTRQIGGTLGTAVFLSVLFSTVPDKIAEAMRTAGPGSADFQAALASPTGDPAANAQFIEALKQGAAGGAAVNPLSDSSFLNVIDPRLARPFLIGFSESMDLVFLIGAIVMAVAFFWVMQLPHVELRTTSAYQQRADDLASEQRAHGQALADAEGKLPTTSASPEARASSTPPTTSPPAGAPG